MEKVLSYPLGPVPWSLGTADGTPTQTDKAKLMHYLEGDSHQAEMPTEGSVVCVLDGNALLHAQVSLPATFGELVENIFQQLPQKESIHLVTDCYHPMSIKGIERE